MFSLCAGTHLCTQGHTHLGVLALCVCMCVCLHRGLQLLVCCDGPSSLLKFFISLSILIECSLDRWLPSCLTKRQENSQFFSWHLIPPSLSTPCSFFWCRRRPQREENCFEQVEQEYCWSAMLPHCFPTKSEVKLKLTAASHTPFTYDLQIVWCTRVTMRIITCMICYAYYI